MQDCYNVIQASKYIGADPKTIRRWLKQGKLTGTRTDRGWLAIPYEQVERMRIEWENERKKFAIPSPHDASLGTLGREDLDIIRRVEALEQKVAELEKALSSASLDIPRQSVPVPATSAIPPKSQPQIATTAINSLPDGCILARDFARMHGVPESSFRRHIASGIGSEKVEAGSSKYGRYLTPAEQEEAIAFWIRHNVKFT